MAIREKSTMINIFVDRKEETDDDYLETTKDVFIDRNRFPLFGKVCLISKNIITPLIEEIMNGQDQWASGKIPFEIRAFSKSQGNIEDQEVIMHAGLIDIRTQVGKREAGKLLKSLRAWFEIQSNQQVWQAHIIIGYFENDSGIFSMVVNSLDQMNHFIEINPYPSPFDTKLRKVRFFKIVRRKKKIL